MNEEARRQENARKLIWSEDNDIPCTFVDCSETATRWVWDHRCKDRPLAACPAHNERLTKIFRPLQETPISNDSEQKSINP